MRITLAVLLLASSTLQAHENGPVEGHTSGRIDCQQSLADEFACQRVDMLSHMSVDELAGGTTVNDLWGWTDSLTNREYALVGTFDGTVFVDITNPETPVRLGFLRGRDQTACRHRDTGGCAEGSVWRDVKVYADHAFIVSEAAGHGMQVFDLTALRNGVATQNYTETAWYGGFGSAHNLAINEDTGFAYALGTTTFLGGPHFVDVSTPTDPRAAGGFNGDEYTHDAQCVTYDGADADYTGAEICFLSNEDTVTIVNVSDKNNPVMLSRSAYPGATYTHQGWLDEGHLWFYVNDEADETQLGGQTITYIWNLANLDAPVLFTTYRGMTESIDHNNYVRGDYLYQSNYTSGLRILDISTRDQPLEVAWFDSFPIDDLATFDGSWSNYPYFPSGVIALSDVDYGLFLLRPTLATSLPAVDLSTSINNLQQTGTAMQYRYDAVITNTGTTAADDVIASLVLDPGITTLGVTGGSCQRRGRFADCAIGQLNPGDIVTLGFTLTASSGGQKNNRVQVTARNADPDTANNKASSGLSLPVSPTLPVAPSGGGGGGVVLWEFLALLFAAGLRRSTAREGGRQGSGQPL